MIFLCIDTQANTKHSLNKLLLQKLTFNVLGFLNKDKFLMWVNLTLDFEFEKIVK